MPLPASGALTLNDVNVELGLSGTAALSLDDLKVRVIAAGLPTGTVANSSFLLAGSTIAFSDLRGKSYRNYRIVARNAGDTADLTNITEGSSMLFKVYATGYANNDTLAYTLSGTSTAGTDYTISPSGSTLTMVGTVALSVGTLTVSVTADNVVEGTETIIFTAGGLSKTVSIDDGTRPTVVITRAGSGTLTTGTDTITFTLPRESSSTFTSGDVTVTGGTISNFTGSGASYTATFTVTSGFSGNATIDVAANTFVGSTSGNQNLAATQLVIPVSSNAGITIASSSSSLTIAQTSTITFTLSQPSTNFISSDVTVSIGSLTNFTGSGTSYTATYVPPTLAVGTASISVAAGAFTSGGTANSQSNTINISYQTYNEVSLAIQSTLASPTVGGTNGTATAIAQDGSGNFSYSWTLVSTGAVLGTGTTISGLSNSTQYRITVTDNVTNLVKFINFQTGENSFYYAFDWMIISYLFTDGGDLDTRTRPLSPVAPDDGKALGWGQLDMFPPPVFVGDPDLGGTVETQSVWTWGGDNTGTGFETVLLDLTKFRATYPGVTSLTAALSCGWYGSQGYNPIVLGCNLYQGGTPSLTNKQWSVAGSTDQLVIESVAVPCTDTLPSNPRQSSPGQLMAVLSYNLTSTLGTFTVTG